MMEKVTLHVSGMSCGHCVKAIEGSVGNLQGVDKVTVDLTNGKVDVEYNSSDLSLEAIKETIEDQGYEVV